MKKFNSIFMILGASFLSLSCGVKTIEDTVGGGNETPNPRVIVDPNVREAGWDRLCSNVVVNTPNQLKSNLEKYFFSTLNGFPSYPGEVKDLEPPVTWCMMVQDGGDFAAFRIEYEDHYGGGWYEMAANKSDNVASANEAPILFYSDVSTTTIDIIFLDAQGFTQILGTKQGDEFVADIRYANIAPQGDYTDDFIDDIVQKCQSGEWNVAQCLGYNFPPTFWWEDQFQQPSQNTLEMAREMLEGGHSSESGTIGTINFRISDILQ